MIDSCVRLTLDVQEDRVPVALRVKRGDTGRKLQIYISDGGRPYQISKECYAVFTARKADKTKIHNPCTIDNNVIEYQFTERTCSAVGRMVAEIKLYGADRKMITSASFVIDVFETVYTEGDEVSSEGEMNTLDALISDANALIKDVQQKLDNGEFAGGVQFTTDDTLILNPDTGVLSVNTADVVEEDNTLPVTSAAVYTVVGNISSILDTI